MERRALALTGSGDFVFDWNIERDRVTVSDELGTRLGERRGALRGSIKRWLDRVHAEDRDRFRTAFDTLVELRMIATAYILPQDAGSASSLFNILRNLGGAIGIALLATLLDARAKIYFDYLRESIVPTNPQVAERLSQLTNTLGSEQAALGKLSEIVHQQATIMAYNDAFHFIGIALGISMLAVLLTRPLPKGMQGGAAH